MAAGNWQLAVSNTWKINPNYVFKYLLTMLNINIICKFTYHLKDDYLSSEVASRQMPAASNFIHIHFFIEPLIKKSEITEMLKFKNMLYNMFNANDTANDTANDCMKKVYFLEN